MRRRYRFVLDQNNNLGHKMIYNLESVKGLAQSLARISGKSYRLKDGKINCQEQRFFNLKKLKVIPKQ